MYIRFVDPIVISCRNGLETIGSEKLGNNNLGNGFQIRDN